MSLNRTKFFTDCLKLEFALVFVVATHQFQFLAYILKKTVPVQDPMPHIYLAETSEKSSAETKDKAYFQIFKR